MLPVRINRKLTGCYETDIDGFSAVAALGTALTAKSRAAMWRVLGYPALWSKPGKSHLLSFSSGRFVTVHIGEKACAPRLLLKTCRPYLWHGP